MAPEGLCTKCSATQYCAEHHPRHRMSKREARRHAHHVAYIWIQKALDSGPGENSGVTDDEQLQIENELDRLAQRHFELGEKRGT